MTVLVTPEEMAVAEARAIEAGTSAEVLMRRAAEAIAGWLEQQIPINHLRQRRIVGLIGPGNNGGDALVTLGILSQAGWIVQAFFVRRVDLGTLPMSDAERTGIELTETVDVGAVDVVLDGVFGFRSRASLPSDIAEVFHGVNTARLSRPVPVVAVDVPSGVDPGTGAAAPDALRADATLCLGLPKIGLIREPAATVVGELVVVDIGIAPPEIAGRPRLLDASAVAPLLPRRAATAHKHQTGAVVIVGGAPTYYGAPRLSAEAALRAGAGLVAAAVPSEIVPVLAAQVPEVVVVPLGAGGRIQAIEGFVAERASSLRALVIGPGLGRDDSATTLLGALLSDRAPDAIRRLTKVIDADALNWMSDLTAPPAGLERGTAVLTPHPGEMSRLLGTSTSDVLADPIGHAAEAAVRFGQVVILKCGYSPVAHPDGGVWLAPRSTPELATAGTGDVLSGLIGGLLAQGLNPWDAARVGIFCGAEAGRRAAHVHGTRGTIARDVIGELGGAIQSLVEPAWIA